MNAPRISDVTIRGQKVPQLGLGTWRLEGDTCRRIVSRALELGYRHLDTAQGYGNEAEVGRALAESGVPRDEIFLTTKAWPDDLVHAKDCAAQSLERLRVSQVDLFLIHWPSPTLPLEQTIDALREVKARGLAKQIGVSNFPPGLLTRALERAPELFCNQVEYHPFLPQPRLLDLARKHDLLFAAYSPLARGDVAHPEALKGIGERHGKTASQVALRWLVQQEKVCAIPKTANEARLAENLAIFDFALSDDEVRRIHALATGKRYVNPEWGPDWED